MYQTPGRGYESAEINREPTNMVMDMIRSFKTRPFNIDAFENFVVKYEDKEGSQEVFDLLKGKVELLKEVDITSLNSRKWYELIEEDFNEFMTNFGKE